MIKTICLTNFMSYSSAEIPLSPGVNFICGPNGAGKSTILIAISLALGMSHTERGRRLSDLIRWGADRSIIRIVLDNSGNGGERPFPDFEVDDLVIERTLHRAGSYPIKIDGVTSTKEELTELIGERGINPDNMLIIMQQDMVEEFSLLSPADKLSMLEEVIEFRSYRQDLLKASDELEVLLGEEKQTRRILDGSNRRVTEWERLYEKYQRKRGLEDQLEDLSAESLWARVVEGERILHQLESRLGERSQELDQISRRLEDFDKRIEERSGQVDEAWTELESSKVALVDVVSRHAANMARVEVLEDRLSSRRLELERIRESIDRDRADVDLAMRRIEEIAGGGERDGDEASKISLRISKLKVEIADLTSAKEILEKEREISLLEARSTEMEKKMSRIRECMEDPLGHGLGKAGEEIRAMTVFEGEVFGPIYTCIESDDLSLDVLRSLLGDALMRSFVTTNENDRRKLIRILEERGIGSTAYSVPDSALVMIEERYLPEDDGVLGWAVDRIRAPDHVKALLRRMAGKVLLVRSDKPVDDFAAVLGTPVINREGQQAGLDFGLIGRMVTAARNRKKDLKRELDQLTGNYSGTREKINGISTDLEILRAERDAALDSALRELLSLQSRLEVLVTEEIPSDLPLRLESERVRNTSGALADYKERMFNEGRRELLESERFLEKEKEAGKKIDAEVNKREVGYQRTRERLERQLKSYYDLESKRLVLVDQTRSTRASIRDLEYRISKRREDVEQLVQNAEELSPRISSPRDLLELEKEISNIRGSLSELDEVPDDIEGVYKMYLSEFETLRQSLESIIGKREEMQAELRKGLGRWREIMNGYLEDINRDFNEILGEIGGRGRVRLVGDDVRKVGLDIWIGFEGKEMISISTLAQSGGEKSLSTMAFLLALQRQIKSPFRAVDEYDVHLDPMNRNRVTSLLKSAVRRDSKQYIAITPSQISRQDLEDAENVVIVQSVEGKSRAGSLVLEASR